MSVYLVPEMDEKSYKIFEKWIENLRSGLIPQGYFRLGNGDKRCCLGVLRDLVNWKCHPKYYSDNESYLPNGAGILKSGAGDGISAPMHCSLNELNDHSRASFEDIADILEADFLGLLDGKEVKLTF